MDLFSTFNVTSFQYFLWLQFVIFGKILNFFFKFSENFYHVPNVWIFMSQWNYFRLDKGILDSLLRQSNRSWDINIVIYAKFWNLQLFPKLFNIFCPFLSLTTITGQRIFLSLGGGFLDRAFQTKMVLSFLPQSWKLVFNFAFFSFFLFDLFTNKARKVEVGYHHGNYSYLSFSLPVRFSFLLFSFTFYLSLLAALELLLCGVMSSSLIFINNEL